MQPHFFNSMTANQVYVSLWSKYRPAILQLMVASEGGTQQYKLFNHEFKALGPKEKSFSFDLRAHKGKAVNSVSPSMNAKNLLEVLSTSRKACELMDETTFQFKLDSHFVLHITRI